MLQPNRSRSQTTTIRLPAEIYRMWTELSKILNMTKVEVLRRLIAQEWNAQKRLRNVS